MDTIEESEKGSIYYYYCIVDEESIFMRRRNLWLSLYVVSFEAKSASNAWSVSSAEIKAI